MDADPDCGCQPCVCETPEDCCNSCGCNPCTCESEPGPTQNGPFLEGKQNMQQSQNRMGNYNKNSAKTYDLDEFTRAKEFFMKPSSVTGLSLYEHLGEVIKKILDDRAPANTVDFLEEISMNVKKYKFRMKKDLIKDSFHMSESLVKQAQLFIDNWQENAEFSEKKANLKERNEIGGFPNLLRLQYFMEHVNVGLPKQEMFRIALEIRKLSLTKPVLKIRFWGKIFATQKNYYVAEAELKEETNDTWNPASTSQSMTSNHQQENARSVTVPEAGDTFTKAGNAVTNLKILTAYSDQPPQPSEINNTASKEGLVENEQAKWEQFQKELMENFPVAAEEKAENISPPEPFGQGVNKRSFFVCNSLGGNWFLLPLLTPEQIICSRKVRWFLTGDLNVKLLTYPEFPGLEGHYLRALLSRITASSQVSPKGYYKRGKKVQDDTETDVEEEEEEEEDEEIDEEGDDSVAIKRFQSFSFVEILDSSGKNWVHHISDIDPLGRVLLNSTETPKKKKFDEDEETEEEEVEEESEKGMNNNKTTSLFRSLDQDTRVDVLKPWSIRPASSVFTEFQIAFARSNIWPGASSICTIKGKVENIYFGDGLKFSSNFYAPLLPEKPEKEYKVSVRLMELRDPTVEQEKNWLAKTQLDAIADEEEEFYDNEEEDEEEEETETEVTESDF